MFELVQLMACFALVNTQTLESNGIQPTFGEPPLQRSSGSSALAFDRSTTNLNFPPNIAPSPTSTAIPTVTNQSITSGTQPTALPLGSPNLHQTTTVIPTAIAPNSNFPPLGQPPNTPNPVTSNAQLGASGLQSGIAGAIANVNNAPLPSLTPSSLIGAGGANGSAMDDGAGQSGFVNEIGAEYWIISALQIPRWINITTPTFLAEVQARLRNLVTAAVERQQSRRYGVAGGNQPQVQPLQANRGFQGDEFSVRILNLTRQERSNNVQILFATKYKEAQMPAATLLEDMRLLNSAEQSAIVGYPVMEMKTYLAEESTEKRNLWIIGVVIGSVVALLLCGWCTLFIYYNTCGRIFRYNTDDIDRKTATSVEHPSAPQKPAINAQSDERRRDERVMDAAGAGGGADHHRYPREDSFGEDGLQHQQHPARRETGQRQDADASVDKIYLISTQVQTELASPEEDDAKDGGEDTSTNGTGQKAAVFSNQRRFSIKGGVSNWQSNSASFGNKLVKIPSRGGLLSPDDGSSTGGGFPVGSTPVQTMEGNGTNNSVGNLTFNPSTTTQLFSPGMAAGMRQLAMVQDMSGMNSATSPAAMFGRGSVGELMQGQMEGTTSHNQSQHDALTPIPSSAQLNDIWSLYPWRPYQAGDQTYWLTKGDDQSPDQSTAGPDGSIVMHSKLLKTGSTIPKNEGLQSNRRFDVNPLLGLI